MYTLQGDRVLWLLDGISEAIRGYKWQAKLLCIGSAVPADETDTERSNYPVLVRHDRSAEWNRALGKEPSQKQFRKENSV